MGDKSWFLTESELDEDTKNGRVYFGRKKVEIYWILGGWTWRNFTLFSIKMESSSYNSKF